MLDRCVPGPVDGARALPLPFAQRRRSRQRWTLADGREIAWALPPGTVLRLGDVLCGGGDAFEVHAADEHVLRVTASDPRDLARAAYHLGNRHVLVEVGEGHLAIEPDAVLQDMLTRLGVHVHAATAPFVPETGAYGGGHRHGHADSFGEDHALAQAVFELRAPR